MSFDFYMVLHFKADTVMSLQENITKTLQQQASLSTDAWLTHSHSCCKVVQCVSGAHSCLWSLYWDTLTVEECSRFSFLVAVRKFHWIFLSSQSLPKHMLNFLALFLKIWSGFLPWPLSNYFLCTYIIIIKKKLKNILIFQNWFLSLFPSFVNFYMQWLLCLNYLYSELITGIQQS